MAYAALWVKSNYAFLEGASHPEELVERAHGLGLAALAVTDRDGVYGVARAHVRAKELGQRLIVGAQLSVGESAAADPNHHVVLLARTREGYGSLCRLISRGQARRPKGESLVTIDEVRSAAGGLVALCPESLLLGHLADAYGEDLYALCARHRQEGEVAAEARLRGSAAYHGVAVVAANEVLYHDRRRRALQDVLTCIRHGTTLAAAGTRIRSNAEHDLLDASAMERLFVDDPEALERSLEVVDKCEFTLDQIRYRYPAEAIPDGQSPGGWLRTLTLKGALHRYDCDVPADVAAQIERELELISDLDYGGYFLTMHEIVEYCRAEGILCQGRGSAANSVVCYCLGITAIDPVRMDLLFERFLSRERAEPPDIDLDIEHERREEVIQHVYQRYGRRHAAMVANVIRYRVRSAIRDIGKVLGLSSTELDAVARLLSHYSSAVDEETLKTAGIDAEAKVTQHLLGLVAELQEFPRHLSIHPGGFLLGDAPVDTLVPIEPATMEDRTVIQWDKYDVEALGLFKVDLLGLGALTAIHRSFDLLRAHDGLALEIATVPAEDQATYEMITKGDTVGVFQIESRAQMAMLPRLRPQTFYDLVIEVAIVRPGPIQGDMVHPYLRRRQGDEAVSFPHESLHRVLDKTLGVPIFQEQVMKLAILAADYTPGEADQLRRDMAAWRSAGRIEAHHERLVSRMVSHGIPEDFAERVFSQIRGFGEYGFPESHAASFALLAYVTAWLRCHHPAVFTCAMLNAQPMGFYSASTLVEDAKHHGVEVRPVDANLSHWDCTLEPGGPIAAAGQSTDAGTPSPDLAKQSHALRMGLRYVDGLGSRERDRIMMCRPYRSLEQFASATRLSRRALTALAEAGAFDGFGRGRRDALWRIRGLASSRNDAITLDVPDQSRSFPTLAAEEEIAWDYRSSSHSSRGHPMMALRAELAAQGRPTAAALRAMAHDARANYVGMVICRQRPGTASGVTFFTLEDETGFVNVVVWRDTFDRHALVAKTASPLGVRGRLQVAGGVTHLIADSLYAPELRQPARAPAPYSRDFH